MIVLGGTYKTVSQIDDLCALDVRGLKSSSNVFSSEAILGNYDAYEAEIQTMYLLVANNGNAGSINGGATGILSRSYLWLSPTLIEMLPKKSFLVMLR